jgi:hypothetical protein
MTTMVPTARSDRTLTQMGLGAALLGPFTGLGIVVALVVAAVLFGRGEKRAAALLILVALLAVAVLYVVVQAFFMPVSPVTTRLARGVIVPA